MLPGSTVASTKHQLRFIDDRQTESEIHDYLRASLWLVKRDSDLMDINVIARLSCFSLFADAVVSFADRYGKLGGGLGQ